MLTALPLSGVLALAATSGDFQYEVLSEADKTCEITGYTGTATELEIPSTLDGYTVTRIGEHAFIYCASLTSVNIPNGVTSIGEYAFYSCSSLTSIDIPNSVTSIGNSAFSNCDLLESIHIPSSVTSVGNYAFSNCYSLSSATIGNNVTSIGNSAFSDCYSLESIHIPDSVTSIGDLAFVRCSALTNITLPDSVINIGEAVFHDCNNLTIYGHAGSYAETYAAENDIPFKAVTSVTDEASGVVLNGAAETIPANASLQVNCLDTAENRITYDITLTQNGNPVQPAGDVTVKIPVPETMDGELCRVYRAEADGTYTDMNAVYQNGYMVFTTDHFSRYILQAAPRVEKGPLAGALHGGKRGHCGRV